ncbi:CpsD/CapB family tyrosine-protein kinase [Paenibacillus sp. GCM10023250]|uniref:CpsD/CapB family tyrosine-protein kinase n=1 Tax=Paenibacillus sp. GCM10023250 TaxID=3252648 RepID=UPI00360DF072
MRQSTNDRHSINIVNTQTAVSEVFRTIRTNIQFSSSDSPVKVIMVAAAQRGEGKTTTICNLAVAFAEEGKSVLLIDGDLRNPKLDQLFSFKGRDGLSNVLANQVFWGDVVADTGIPNLSVLVSGPIPPNPAVLLGSNRMSKLVEEVRNRYDVILIDTSPVGLVTDSIVLSTYCDGVVMIVSSEQSDKQIVRKAKASLEHVNARILGVVFNNLKQRKAPAY